MIGPLSKYSLDNYLQSKYQQLSNDKAEGIEYFANKHFVKSNNDNMSIYHINQDDVDGKKCNLLKILNKNTIKWDIYKLKSSSKKIDVKELYIWDFSFAILNNNDLFIKYGHPARYREPDKPPSPSEDPEYSKIVNVLTILKIDHDNHEIKDGELVDIEPPNSMMYDFYANTGPNELFIFNNKCHAIVGKNAEAKKVQKGPPFYSCGHYVYNGSKNKFIFKHTIPIQSEHANVDIVSNELCNLLLLFESYTLASEKHYYLRIHRYNTKNDSFTVEKIKDVPPMLRYNCYVILKGHWIVFFHKCTTNGYNEYVYLYNYVWNKFRKTKCTIPICAEYKAVKIEDTENDLLTVTGFIRRICDTNNYQMVPQYLLKCIANYYVNEQIYLICSSVDECLEYIWNQNTERHNFYRFNTWLFPADILFE